MLKLTLGPFGTEADNVVRANLFVRKVAKTESALTKRKAQLAESSLIVGADFQALIPEAT
jgi:hypothetical protein